MTVSSCADTADIAGQVFQPVHEGRLVVATSLPAPGFWNGSDPSNLTGGFEYGIAEKMAERFDLDLEIVDRPFDEIVGGDLTGVDMALAQISVTDARSESLAFSTPYYRNGVGVIMSSGAEMADLKSAQEAEWAVQKGTIEVEVLNDMVQPDNDPIIRNSLEETVAAVADGKVDAALVDLSTALIVTNGREDLTTVARFVVDLPFAVAMPLDSDNVEVVNAAIRALDNDGTLDSLSKSNLIDSFEKDPDSVPVIRTSLG
ncbi:ABC transporter substrate-binding protein [Ilumatobacter sp.]|uniref:ABC transporter substrate-binding protein n=1 Tax=Ilumatobacter sp. TaxID=1967498 RepID=UPI003C541783